MKFEAKSADTKEWSPEWHELSLYSSIWTWSLWLSRLLAVSSFATFALGFYLWGSLGVILTTVSFLQYVLARAVYRYAHNLRHYLNDGQSFTYLRLLSRQRNLIALITVVGISVVIGITSAALGLHF